MTIYLDVLLLSNLWVDYFLLRAVSHMTHTPLTRRRAVLAAGVGALSSLMIFLPPMHTALSWCVRVLIAGFLCFIAFGKCPLRLLLRQWISLQLAAMVFCGVIYTIGSKVIPYGMTYGNGIFYVDVSLTVLLIGAVISAAITTYTTRKRQQTDTDRYHIELFIAGIRYSMPALCDSGNSLRDPFSGLPVILCSATYLKPWLNNTDDIIQTISGQHTFRMLPVNTVTGQKLLPAFLPETLMIYDNQKPYPRKAMLAVTAENVPALFSPALLP